MRIGVLMTGDRAVRAAHSLAADPVADEVVVVGPAKSRSFKVVEDATGCDVLIGSGPSAPGKAREFGVPLVWDGDRPANGVAVWGANQAGLALAMAERETKVTRIAIADPDAPPGSGKSIRFARPVGATQLDRIVLGDRSLFRGKCYNDHAGCLVVSKSRRVTIIDKADFLSGIALAAGVSVLEGQSRPVWESSLVYLETAVAMGLVMAITP
jgi:hypothetical protein